MKILKLNGESEALATRLGDIYLLDTHLVDNLCQGDWVLVFLDRALEIIEPQRANDINALLSLVLSTVGALADQQENSSPTVGNSAP